MLCSPVCVSSCHAHLFDKVLCAQLGVVCLSRLCCLQVDAVYLGWAGGLFSEKTTCNMGSSDYVAAVVEGWDGALFAPSSPSAASEVKPQTPAPYPCIFHRERYSKVCRVCRPLLDIEQSDAPAHFRPFDSPHLVIIKCGADDIDPYYI